jgi:hypothetical protein
MEPGVFINDIAATRYGSKPPGWSRKREKHRVQRSVGLWSPGSRNRS